MSKDNKVYFSIIGTIGDNSNTFEYYPKLLKTTDNKTKYIGDPNLDEGKTVVKQKGSKGYTVDTYKIVKRMEWL